MRYNSLFGAFAALLAAFAVSCTDLKEFEDRMDLLETRIKVLEAEVSIFNGNVESLQSLVNGATINNVTEKDGIYTITCSNGDVLTINQGSIGVGHAPVVSIDKEGYWMADYGEGPVYILDHSGNKVRAMGIDGITPLFGVDENGYWTVKFGDAPAQQIKGADGQPVSALSDDEVASDGFFKNVEYDEAGQLFIITLTNGNVYDIPVIPSFLCAIEGAKGVQLFQSGESKTYAVQIRGVSKTFVTVPYGWDASLSEPSAENLAILTVSAPAVVKSSDSPAADTRSDLSILALSHQGYATVAKMTVSMEGGEVTVSPKAAASYVGSTENSIEYKVILADATRYKYIIQGASIEAPSSEKIAAEGVEGPTEGNLIVSELSSGTQYTLYVLPMNGDVMGEIVTVTESTEMGDISSDLYAAYQSGSDLVFGDQVINIATFGEANLIMAGGSIDKPGVHFIDSEAIMAGPANNGTKVVIIGRYANRRSVVKYSKVCYINGTADDNDLFVMANIDYQLDGTAQTYLFNNGNADNFETMILDNCRLEMPADKKFIQTNGSREIDNIQIVNCDCKIGGGKEPWLVYTGAGDPLNLTLKNNIFWNASETGMSAFQILYSKKDIGNVVLDKNTFVNIDSNSYGYIYLTTESHKIEEVTISNNLFYIPNFTGGYRKIIRYNPGGKQVYENNAAVIPSGNNGLEYTVDLETGETVNISNDLNPFDPTAGGTYDLAGGIFVPTTVGEIDFTVYGASR